MRAQPKKINTPVAYTPVDPAPGSEVIRIEVVLPIGHADNDPDLLSEVLGRLRESGAAEVVVRTGVLENFDAACAVLTNRAALCANGESHI